MNFKQCFSDSVEHVGGWNHCAPHLAEHYEQFPEDRPWPNVAHGSDAGIYQHKKRKEPPCTRCKAGQADRQRARYIKKNGLAA
jgi:hypothetical protein